MSFKNKGKDIIEILAKEAKAYSSLESIEKMVESGGDLSNLPIQPLYLVIRNMSEAVLAQHLDKFSPEQRQAFLDLDLWIKDDLDVQNFVFWPKVYAQSSNDEVIKTFVKSEEFLLYLKAKFNLWTFDVDDPLYPDHDYYFLTDDNLLLFEYDESNNEVEEIQKLIRLLYYYEGVENAYGILFKLTTDSFLIWQEEEYRLKRGRLEDYGFIDYYDALEIDNVYPTIDFMNKKIKNKIALTPEIDSTLKMQILDQMSILPYEKGLEEIGLELLKVTNEKRQDYLEFNFIRLVNSSIILNNDLKGSRVSLSRIASKTKVLMLLGHDYIRESFPMANKKDSIFMNFDFAELFKIGNTLIRDINSRIKKNLNNYNFEESREVFLGKYWSDFLDNIFDSPSKIESNEGIRQIQNMKDYNLALKKTETFLTILPFAKSLMSTFFKLVENGNMTDALYLNYNVSDIDLEAILLSNFANLMLGNFGKGDRPKMGLTILEFRKWAESLLDENGCLKKKRWLKKEIIKFKDTFGLIGVPWFELYFQEILDSHMNGYKMDEVKDSDLEHIGGPIIFHYKT